MTSLTAGAAGREEEQSTNEIMVKNIKPRIGAS
jgi:hypothetical protein